VNRAEMLRAIGPITYQDRYGENGKVEVGWCAKHDDLAQRWLIDGSWSCWWEHIVESNGDHADTDFVPLMEWQARLVAV
jgi:hypothetical protein